jgi:hypothetical protein
MWIFVPPGMAMRARPRKVEAALMVVLEASMVRLRASGGRVSSREISNTPAGRVRLPVLVWSAWWSWASGLAEGAKRRNQKKRAVIGPLQS